MSKVIFWTLFLIIFSTSTIFAGTIEGKLADSTGKVIQGAIVSLSYQKRFHERSSSDFGDAFHHSNFKHEILLCCETTTDSEGKYTFKNLPPNEYFVEMNKPSANFDPKRIVLENVNDRKIINFLDTRLIVKGKVTNALGIGLKNAVITVRDASFPHEASEDSFPQKFLTDGSGSYHLYFSRNDTTKYKIRARLNTNLENIVEFSPVVNLELKQSLQIINFVVGEDETGTINGNIIDNLGVGAKNLYISLRNIKGDLRWNTSLSTRSDEAGNYSFSKVPIGEYIVKINTIPGYTPYCELCFLGESNYSEFDFQTSILSDQNSIIDLQIDRATGIKGIVKDNDGSPSKYATVSSYSSNSSLIDTHITNEEGEYIIPVSEGHEKIYLQFGNIQSGNPWEFYNDAQSLNVATAIIPIKNQHLTLEDITLGNLEHGRVNGTVTDAKGQVASNISISAKYLTESGYWQILSTVTTNSNGVYEFNHLPENEYRFALAFNPYIPFPSFRDWNDKKYFSMETTESIFASEETINNLDIQIDKRGSINGKITDTSGNPLPNIKVDVFFEHLHSDSSTSWESCSLMSTTSDINGDYLINHTGSCDRFAIENIQNFRLSFTGNFNWQNYYPNASDINSAKTLEFLANESQTINAVLNNRGTGTITGTVKDNATQESIWNAIITIEQKVEDTWNPVMNTYPISNGFYILNFIKSNNYRIRISAPEYKEELIPVFTLNKNENKVIRITLQKITQENNNPSENQNSSNNNTNNEENIKSSGGLTNRTILLFLLLLLAYRKSQ